MIYSTLSEAGTVVNVSDKHGLMYTTETVNWVVESETMTVYESGPNATETISGYSP